MSAVSMTRGVEMFGLLGKARIERKVLGCVVY